MNAPRFHTLGVALGFARDVAREFTWRKLLLVQVLALIADIIANVVMSLPDGIVVLRLVIAQTMALSIVISACIGNQAVARGVRPLFAYALPLVVMSVVGAYAQSRLLMLLNREPPGWDFISVIDIGCEILSYGAMFLLVYVDHRRRLDLARRIRVAELERARNEQQLTESRLAEFRAGVDPVELMVELDALRTLYDRDAEQAERMLDELIDALRAKLAPDTVRQVAVSAMQS